MGGDKKTVRIYTEKDLNEAREIYNPVTRRLKTAARTYSRARNLYNLAGNSSERIDTVARGIGGTVAKINELTERFSTPDESGNYPRLTESDLKKLNTLYAEALKECNNMINGAGMSKGTKNSRKFKTYAQTAEKIRSFLLLDMKYLQTANTGLGDTLPDIIENSRKIVIKPGMASFDSDKLSGKSSSRIPMTLTLPNGKKVKGIFTENDDFDPMAEFNAIFDKLKVDPSLGEFLDSLKFDPNEPLEPEFDPEGKKNIDTLLARGTFITDEIEKLNEDKQTVDPLLILRGMTGKTNPYLKTKPGFDKAVEALAQPGAAKKFTDTFLASYNRFMTRTNFNYKLVGIKSGNLNVKSAACSVLASLVGRPDLIANTVMMEVQRGGKTVKGSFMEFVDGTDLLRLKADKNDQNFKSYFGLKVNTGIDKSFVLKDIYDMEMLDIIFGNIDSHGGNILYNIDYDRRHSKYVLNGIKRIDLDNTFIEKPLGESGIQNLPAIKDMKVISRGMAERISSLDGETIKLALRGFMKSDINPMGITENAVDQVIARLNEVKSRIDYKQKTPEAGKLMVIDDKDWKKYTLKELAPEMHNKNPMGAARDINSWISDKNNVIAEAEDRQKKKAAEKNNNNLIPQEEDPGVNKDSYGASLPEYKAEVAEKEAEEPVDYVKMQADMVKVEKGLAAVANVWGGSDEYKQMHDQAKELLAMLKEHNENPQNADKNFEEIIDDTLAKFKAKTETYFDRKRGQGQKAANNKNSMKRISAASDASDFIDEYGGKIEERKHEAKQQKQQMQGPSL